jgi:hypothetical protein
MTQISLKYAFKNFKICKYMPSIYIYISNIPIFQQKYAKNKHNKGVIINSK